MHGIIIDKLKSKYEGEILDELPHGIGKFIYINGDRFYGSCKYGKFDGFGEYYYHKTGKYTGYFSNGTLNGIGTYEDNKYIMKGSWRCDRKHGEFIKTNKILNTTYKQTWIYDKKIKNYQIQYIQPAALLTTKNNNRIKKAQISYKGKEKKCIACMENFTNATNDLCGHVVMCHNCLIKCESCPICRCKINKIIKLYIS